MPKIIKEKTQRLELRLTPQERNKINELAKANNKKVSQFVLSQIFNGNYK
jgi:uncharacterized protein (DUF1778 family)